MTIEKNSVFLIEYNIKNFKDNTSILEVSENIKNI